MTVEVGYAFVERVFPTLDVLLGRTLLATCEAIEIVGSEAGICCP